MRRRTAAPGLSASGSASSPTSTSRASGTPPLHESVTIHRHDPPSRHAAWRFTGQHPSSQSWPPMPALAHSIALAVTHYGRLLALITRQASPHTRGIPPSGLNPPHASQLTDLEQEYGSPPRDREWPPDPAESRIPSQGENGICGPALVISRCTRQNPPAALHPRGQARLRREAASAGHAPRWLY